MQRLACALCVLYVLVSCSAAMTSATKSSLYVFRLDPPALIELDPDLQILSQEAISIPAGCGLLNLFAPPLGTVLALEMSCPSGPSVLWLNARTGALRQAITDSDSHFLAWTPNGQAVYLKVNSINRPYVIRADLDGARDEIPITDLTYDIAPRATGEGSFLFSFSRGLGLGSEMWFTQSDGRVVKQVAADRNNYLSLARWSPDGTQIAFIKVPDSQTPFTVGELWVMTKDGSNARSLAQADAGHGFPPAWSPDGGQIAFVVRENASNARADQSDQALVSNISVIDVQSGFERQATTFPAARVEAPGWEPDGNNLAFTVVMNDKMTVHVLDVISGQLRGVPIESACCAAWVIK